MLKKLLILISIAVLVFSSGCLDVDLPWATQKDTQTSYGVNVASFETDFPEVESGDTIELYLEIENDGGSKATDVYAYLYNLGDLMADEEDHEFGDLEPPDETVNLPGDIDTYTWGIEVPALSQGISQTYSPKVRLMYKYYTMANTKVVLLTKDEYRRLREKNQVPSGSSLTTVTKGPLGVQISAREPVIIEENDDTFKIFVTVDTIGTGSVFDPDVNYETPEDLSNDDLGKIKMMIEAPGTDAVSGECDALDDYQSKDLRRGQTLTYTCELNPDSFATMTEIPIKVTLYYGYLKDFSTSIRVVGTEDITAP